MLTATASIMERAVAVLDGANGETLRVPAILYGSSVALARLLSRPRGLG